MDARSQVLREAFHPLKTQLEEYGARRGGIASQAGDIHSVADSGKSREQLDAVVQLDHGTVEIVVPEQVMHPHTHLQDALVEVADLAWRRTPEQLECFVLFEEFSGVELLNSACQLRRRGRRAG